MRFKALPNCYWPAHKDRGFSAQNREIPSSDSGVPEFRALTRSDHTGFSPDEITFEA